MSKIKTPEQKKKARQKEAAKILAMRNILVAVFPKCFFPKGAQKKPLKIGIDKDILEQFPEISKTILKRTIVDYTQGPTYFENIKIGADRIDLNGNPSGKVDQGGEEHAKLRKAALEEKIKKYSKKKEMSGG